MIYRKLGNTGLEVSEIGLGGEWLERHDTDEVAAVMEHAGECGINILDCWMSNPKVRSDIGDAIRDVRDRWIIQGHIGSTWQNGQYVRTRDMKYVKPAFEDLLERFHTDHVELGMIHYLDRTEDWNSLPGSPYMDYVLELRKSGVIRHIGISTHNPEVALAAAESGIVEMMLFSINPAFDLLPVLDTDVTIDDYYDEKTYSGNICGIDKMRSDLYKCCERNGVGITVMKAYAGGRLLDAELSPFGVAMTPVQLLHYALTRPAVASVLCGYDTPEHVDDAVAYETAEEFEKDYASVIANAPKLSYRGQCTYCGHCKPCPKHIDIALVNKYADLAAMQDSVPPLVRDHYMSLPVNASACTGCGRCLSRCPFGVDIPEKMKQTAYMFEEIR